MMANGDHYEEQPDEQFCRDESCSAGNWTSAILVFIQGHRGGITVAITLTCSVILILLGWIVYKFLKNRKRESSIPPTRDFGSFLPQESEADVRVFTFQEIREATKNFKTIIGRGAQGQVYKGHLPGNIDVAVKKPWDLNKGTAKDFHKEISILQSIWHEHIVVLIGCCFQNGPFLVYEYLPNGTLYSYIKDKKNNTPWSFRLAIAIKVAMGLAHLHSAEILHRDIKAHNILLDVNLEPKISDFGLSKILSPDGETHKSSMKGTHGYMCPQYATDATYEASCDVYSYGVVLAELMSGLSALFEKDGKTKVLAEYFKEESVRDLDECLDEQVRLADKGILSIAAAIACQCMHRTKDGRPSMDLVLEQLQDLQETVLRDNQQPTTSSETSSMLEHPV